MRLTIQKTKVFITMTLGRKAGLQQNVLCPTPVATGLAAAGVQGFSGPISTWSDNCHVIGIPAPRRAEVGGSGGIGRAREAVFSAVRHGRPIAAASPFRNTAPVISLHQRPVAADMTDPSPR